MIVTVITDSDLLKMLIFMMSQYLIEMFINTNFLKYFLLWLAFQVFFIYRKQDNDGIMETCRDSIKDHSLPLYLFSSLMI